MPKNPLDLSQAVDRIASADSKLHRRSNFTSPNRGPDVPRSFAACDMRSARRGDGGADELRRTLGLVNKAAGDFQTYADNKFQRDEDVRGGEGLADGINGHVDEEKMRSSRAYSESLSEGRAQQTWFASVSKIKQGLGELLDGQDDTNPLNRENEVAAYLENSFRTVAIDPETGELDAKLTPKSRGWLAQQMAQLRPQLTVHAQEALRKRMDDESVTNAANTHANRLDAGEGMDVEGSLALLTPTADRKAAKAAIFHATHEWAMSMLDTDPAAALASLDALLVSKREDGTPSFEPEERDRVRSVRLQMEAKAEAAEERLLNKTYDANVDSLLDRLNSVPGAGAYPSMGEVRAARNGNAISAQHANTLLNMIEADQDRAEARANRGNKVDSDSSGPVGDGLVGLILNGRYSASEAMTLAMRAAERGGFSLKELSKFRSHVNLIEAMDAPTIKSLSATSDNWEAQMKDNLGSLPTAKRAGALAEAQQISERAIMRAVQHSHQGKSAEAVYQASMTAGWAVIRSKYQVATRPRR